MIGMTMDELRVALAKANAEMASQAVRLSSMRQSLDAQVRQNDIMAGSVRAMGNELVELVLLYQRGEVSSLFKALADIAPRLHDFTSKNAGTPAAPDVTLGGLH